MTFENTNVVICYLAHVLAGLKFLQFASLKPAKNLKLSEQKIFILYID